MPDIKKRLSEKSNPRLPGLPEIGFRNPETIKHIVCNPPKKKK